MSKVTIFQQNFDSETFVWKKSELSLLGSISKFNEDKIFNLNGYECVWKQINITDFNQCKFEFNDGINIVIYNATNGSIEEISLKNIFKKIESLDSNKIVYFIIPKIVEAHWGWYFNLFSDLNDRLKTLSEIKNLRIIWEYPNKLFDNFYFSSKLAVQTFYNNPIFSYGSLFFNGNSIFQGFEKKYRIGIHIGNLGDENRNFLAESFFENDNKNLWLTVCDSPFNRNIIEQKKLKDVANFKSDNWNETQKDGDYLSDEWYLEQFIEQTIHSEVEVVYETHLPLKDVNGLSDKFTEKTLKHLYLGKPFIHNDPYSYQLLKTCGLKPCTSLYSDKLLFMYETYSSKNKINYLSELKKNIDWLINMDESEWISRLTQAKEITKYNYDKVREYIFETSLLEQIIQIENGSK